MKFDELTILLPCHSLEDFPLHYEGDEAEGLLAAWSALWHPALVAAAGRMPSWARADSPPEDVAGRFLVIPQVSESLLLAGWPARAKNEGALVVRKQTSREEILAEALAALDAPPAIAPELAADFLALGFAYLQVELLTRQMRYMSSLDEVHFQAETIRAAEAAAAGDDKLARRHLGNCFEVLQEARERFYPADTYLIDVTLVASTTLGESLRRELAAPLPLNLLACGALLEEMAAREPQTLAAVRRAVDEGKISIAGGEYGERELPLLPVESGLAELRRGMEVYEEQFGGWPVVYGRRRYGLSPVLPLLLARLGFRGALHASFDEGQFPRSDQSKVRWEGSGATAIDALARLPLDAARPETFLGLPTKLGETMDLDFVATVVFAHWPGEKSRWYGDLRRASAYAPVLGKFVTLANYFEQTDMAGRLTKFQADQYRTPYLKQSVIRRQSDPLSRLADHHRRRGAAEAVETLRVLEGLLREQPGGNEADLREEIERAAAAEAGQFAELDARLEAEIEQAGRRLAEALPGPLSSERSGYLVFNPLSYGRRACVELPEGRLPDVEGAVRAVQDDGSRRLAVVEIPAMGFAWFGASSGGKTSARGASPPMAEGHVLRNDHVEVTLDPTTGAIRSVHDYRTRGNRLSQQLAMRLAGPRAKPGDVWRDPDLEAVYSVMAAERIEVTSAGPALGEIVSRGRLLDLEGRRLAGFRQTLQLWRGSPVLLMDIELDIVEEPRADPWNSYYAARFAWASEEAELRRSIGGSLHATEAKRLEAPLVVEVRDEKHRLAVFPGGLPYHRRIGPRMLDTLLVVRGESRRRFRLAVGFDLAYPMQNALELLSPAVLVGDCPPPVPSASGWLFHVDARNLAATHWERLEDEGEVVGVRVRLLETEGRGGMARLRAFRAIEQARHTDFLGQPLADLTVEDDAVRVDFAAYEWVQVEARWRKR